MFAPDPHPDTLTPAAPGHRDTAPPPSASPAHLLTCSPAQASLPLTARDRELLRLLRDPTGIGTIDPAEYAAWIERPEIQKAIAAQDDLDDRRQRLRDAAHRAERLADNFLARERLRAVLEATMDLTDNAQRTDHRRAATALGRLASSGRAPSSPLGGGGRASRPVGALSSSVFPTGSTEQGRSTTQRTSSAPAAAPSAPSTPSSSSTFPGLNTTVTAFLAAVGAADLPRAAELVANHRIAEIGAHNLMQWLDNQTVPLRGVQLRPGRIIHHAHYDAAEQFIHAVHPDGTPSTWIIGCVLERDPELNPTRWAIAGVNADTS